MTHPIHDAEEILAQEIAPMAQRYMKASAGSMRFTLKPVFDRMDAALAASPLGVACKAGCDYCCHYRVQVSAAEAFALAEQVATLPADQQGALRARIAQTAQRIAPLTKDQHEATNIPCAFLQNRQCSVYAVRPSACRGHHALDAGVCERTFVDPASTELNQLDGSRQAVHEGYKSTILFGQYHGGQDATAYEMHGAVQAALNNPAAFQRWKKGKVAFPEVGDRKSVAQLIAEAGQ
ncbi:MULTISPECIES: YkgJ family cysteine cluster protein [Cupriavidus]